VLGKGRGGEIGACAGVLEEELGLEDESEELAGTPGVPLPGVMGPPTSENGWAGWGAGASGTEEGAGVSWV